MFMILKKWKVIGINGGNRISFSVVMNRKGRQWIRIINLQW